MSRRFFDFPRGVVDADAGVAAQFQVYNMILRKWPEDQLAKLGGNQ